MDAKFGDLDPAYVQSVLKLNQMLDRGVSWSGHEANCCFLNTGTGSFANVSAITGLDFLDDGRGLALLDWDRDGDLDAWTSNRTAPMLRFVRNDTPKGKHYLMLRLEGVECNMDAIGAKVVVELGGASPAKLTRTLRAGEGFLGQSSKWLHFGLGDATEIAKVTVNWPNGQSEDISLTNVDRRYTIRQGSGTAVEQVQSTSDYDLQATPTKLPNQTVQSRALLTSRLPIPPLKITTYDGKEIDAADGQDGPVLLNIWASWCRPCLAELREVSERHDELRTGGLNVYAANVDGLGDDRGMPPEKQREILDRFKYPFVAGVASAELASKMESVVNFVYGPNRPLPVPTSFLIDSSGQLAAVYKGELDVDQLLDDVATIALDESNLQQVALPFPGRWIGQAPPFRPIGLAAEIAENGIDEDLLIYLRRHASLLALDNGYGQFAAEVARKLMVEERYDEASRHLQVVTERVPRDANLWAQLGEVQLQLEDERSADASFRKALTIDENQVVANFQMANLLSRQRKLAAAAKFYERALAVKPDFADAHYQLAAAQFQLRNSSDAVSHMESYVQLRPEDVSARVNLGGMLAALGRLADAEGHLQAAVQEDPDNSLARNNLGRVLQDQGKASAALEQFEIAMRSPKSAVAAGVNLARLLTSTAEAGIRNPGRAIKVAVALEKATSGKNADVLEVLALAQSADKQFNEAMETTSRALNVARAQGNARLVTRLTQNLRRLQQRTQE